MVIETKDHGNVLISEKDIISFPHGVFGFSACRRFVLLSEKENSSPFMWLQNVDGREPRFVVTDPLKIVGNYRVNADYVKSLISLKAESDMRLLAITTVTKGAREVFANLKCPLVINARDNIAAQVILDNDDYPIRYYIYKKEG